MLVSRDGLEADGLMAAMSMPREEPTKEPTPAAAGVSAEGMGG